MEKVIGRFYFKQTTNGNLVGEFSNANTLKAYTESADLLSKFRKGDFTGDYITTWYDDAACEAKLKIALKNAPFENIYTLEWENKFRGEGMI